jgi:hypothetical protein
MSKDIRKMIDKVNNFKQFVNEQQLNEISLDTFKSAIDLSKKRGTDNRTYNLGKLYLNQFMGNDLIGGKITDIGVVNPKDGNYKKVFIEVTKSVSEYIDFGSDYYNKHHNKDVEENIYYEYDIDKDLYDGLDKDFSYNVPQIDRKDADLLSKIAQHINPNTKYENRTLYFNIKGY